MTYDPGAPLCGAIVAMNPDRVIGLAGKIPWHYSADLKRFKSRTLGCTIIMGRLTWESIGSRPLPGRRNIVVSRGNVPDVECYRSVDEAMDSSADSDTWIIGGGQIYTAAMPRLTLLDITYVPDQINHESVIRFPEIDWTQWSEASRETIAGTELLNIIYHRH